MQNVVTINHKDIELKYFRDILEKLSEFFLGSALRDHS